MLVMKFRPSCPFPKFMTLATAHIALVAEKNQGTQRVKYLPKVMQDITGRARTITQVS